MKKIAIITKYMMAGGIEKALINMLRKFPKEQYEITLYVEKLGGDFFGEIPSYVTVKLIPEIEYSNKDRVVKCLKKLKIKQLLKMMNGLINNYRNREFSNQCLGMCKILPEIEERYDLAIAYSAPVSLALFYAAYNIKASKKWTWIHNEVDQITVDIKKAENVFNEYDKIFCVSRLAKQKFDLKLPKYKDKTEIFYNIMDYQRMEEKAKDKIENGFDKNKYKILTVGRVCEEKGQDIIPEIAMKLKVKGIDFKWYILGEGEYQEKIEKEIAQLSIKDRVILLGKKINPYPYFKNCDLYVQTSRQDGYGLTIAEAKFFLKPIITSKTAGAMEQIVDKKNGIIVEFDENQFVDQIIYLYHNDKEYIRIKKELHEEKVKIEKNKKLEEILKNI